MGYQPVTTYRGKRYSAARAFLAPVRGRPNLEVLTDTDVQRIEFKDRRAIGVTVKDRNGIRTIPVAGELILAGGRHRIAQAVTAVGYRPGRACCGPTVSRWCSMHRPSEAICASTDISRCSTA